MLQEMTTLIKDTPTDFWTMATSAVAFWLAYMLLKHALSPASAHRRFDNDQLMRQFRLPARGGRG